MTILATGPCAHHLVEGQAVPAEQSVNGVALCADCAKVEPAPFVPVQPASEEARALLAEGSIIVYTAYLTRDREELVQRVKALKDPLKHGLIVTDHLIALAPVVGMGVTELHWTDREPFEVVAVDPCGKWCDIRPLEAKGGLRKDHVFIPGGFVGHVVDQHSAQEWQLFSVPDASTKRIRLCKGGWKLKTMRYRMGHATKFYDYNF